MTSGKSKILSIGAIFTGILIAVVPNMLSGAWQFKGDYAATTKANEITFTNVVANVNKIDADLISLKTYVKENVPWLIKKVEAQDGINSKIAAIQTDISWIKQALQKGNRS